MMRRYLLTSSLLIAALLLLTHPNPGRTEEKAPTAKPAEPTAAAKAPGDPYLLSTDPVTGEALPVAGQQLIAVWKGRELRFASEANWKTFQADPAKYVKGIDKAMVEAQRKFYPSEDCFVSEQGLEEMGTPVDLIYNNRLIRFCCQTCVGKFQKDPAATLAKLDAAVIKAQGKTYAMKECPVSHEPLGVMGDPVEIVAGNRLIRLCCSGCVEKFQKDPATVLAAVEKSSAKK